MKKTLTTLFFSLFLLPALADDFNLYYDSAEGEASKIEAVAKLQKITFEDGSIVATRTDGTTVRINTSVVRRLFFSTDATVAIDDVREDAINAKKGEIHDLTGRKVNIDLNTRNLPKGIYIIDGKKLIVK